MTDPVHLVAIGGVVGALLRHAVSVAVDRESFPAGTLTVNVVGSFALGLLTALNPGPDATALIGIGVCGSFTTFSSFAVDVVRLWEAGERRTAVGYALANLLGALGAIVVAGWLAALV
ncbi:fluoride efflux transporter CrcB [Haloplanus halobius]|uniref:fluoride efflux transporter CrcB n=1 Tax=Haloplanus halobius TaxID=2934938 RepID=UPI00200E15B4|nr:fluoride efflux transporter CrcB [Haloplanus sp. XH21]